MCPYLHVWEEEHHKGLFFAFRDTHTGRGEEESGWIQLLLNERV